MVCNGDVLILVVTHEGAETVCQTLESCLSSPQEEARPVMVIDNASADHTVSVVKSLSLPGLEVVRMPKNVGVAKAFNHGVKKARQIGARWLFILDQDSICGSCCLDILLQNANDLMKKGEKVGAVCPTAKSLIFSDVIHYPYRWTGRGLEPVLCNEKKLPDVPIAIDSTISSGTLYLVDALTAINGFREEYFIDFVDHECHIRLRRAGWSLWWEKRAVLYHRLGRIQRMTDEGLWVEHDPVRYYYMARNMVEGYWRLGGVRALLQFGGEIQRQIHRLRRFGEAPKKSIHYIFKGVKDAFLGKFGPLDSDD